MAGPWEQYQQAPAAGPWQAYDRRKPVEPLPELTADPSEGMTGMDKFLVGAGSSFDKAVRGVKQLVGGAPADDDAKLYEKHRPKGWETTAGEIFGTAGAQAPLALIPGALPAQMAIQGAGAAAMTPGDSGERLKEGAIGAAGAGVGQVLTKALGRVAKPIGDKSADIVALEAQGVKPTFGQGMGGVVGRAEEAAMSVPLASGPLRRTRAAATDQWRQATRNAALPPGGGPAASIDEVFTRLGDAYKAQLDAVPMPYASVQYQPDMRKLSQGLAVTPDQRQLVQETFEQLRLAHLSNPTPGVQPSAVGAQQVESALKRQAIEWGSSGDPSQRAQGKLFRALADEYGDTWRSALPPGVRPAVAEIDKVYPQALALAKAGASVGAQVSGGVAENYTPAVLTRAARSMDRTPNKRKFLRGEAPQQELARLGQTLQGKVPDSGTTERALLAGGGLGALYLDPVSTLGGAGALAAYGTQPVQNYLMGRAAPQLQEALLRALRAGAPLGGAAGAGAAQQFGE